MQYNPGVRRRRLPWLAVLFCLLLPNTVMAADPPAIVTASSSPSASGAIPQPVAELYGALGMIMRAGHEVPFQQRYQLLAPVIDRVFDLDYVLRASVGRRWPSVPENSRDKLAAAFRRFTVATYVANFDSNEGQRFEILPEIRESGGDQIVQTRMVTSSGGGMRLDYVVHRTDAGWRIVDVLLDGTISRVAVQRSDFRALLGRDEDSLIGSLQRKTIDLSGGTLGP
jgi:phospholipid transport system substrate-binding protein